MAGLDPAIHVDPRVKLGGDGRSEGPPLLDPRAQVRDGAEKDLNHTTAICLRRPPENENRLFGIIAWTPRTMGVTGT